jgi:hypothetical protein
MNAMKQTGGAAFPELKALYKESMSRYSAVSEGGLTVRDYFAAKVLQGICAHPDTWGIGTNAKIASAAYEIADAMLAVRGAA